jgi:adenylate cyclase
MNRRIAWLVSALLLGLTLLLRVQNPAILEEIRHAAFDQYQRWYPAPWREAGVRVIDIDDESLELIGQWPWPRTRVAELIERLAEAGVAAVAFDVLFAEPDRTSPAQLAPLWEADNDLTQRLAQLPDHDSVLGLALARAPTVLGFSLTPQTSGRMPIIKAGFATAGDDPLQFLQPHLRFTGAVPNLYQFELAARGQGSFNTGTGLDRDGVIRRVPMAFALQGAEGRPVLVPSLAAEALRVAQGASGYIIRSSGASGQTALGANSGVNAIRIGAVEAPTDRYGRVWLHDMEPAVARLRRIPAWRVLGRQVNPDDLADRIVFVGTSAAGLKDLRASPLDPNGPGVDIHARIAEQMIIGDFLQRPDWIDAVEIFWLLLFGMLIILALMRSTPLTAALLALLGMTAPPAFAGLAFDRLGLLLDPVYPAAVVLLVYLVLSLLLFMAREVERRQVRIAFAQYVSPAVVETLARNPKLLKLGGELRRVTIMFMDVRDFTSRAEKMKPTELTEFLNRLFTPLTEAVQRHGGTIDKYIGDAIMAFWNAPLDDPDHARHAVIAAREMLAEVARLNDEWTATAAGLGLQFERVRIGIGLNTGEVCVGNMGSRQRFAYSVIGDAVNLAARIEGLCKTYGVRLIVSGATLQEAELATIKLDTVRVKGREAPEQIFTLPEAVPGFGAADGGRIDAAHRRLLAALAARDGAGARAALADARLAAGGSLTKCHDLYESRVATLERRAVRVETGAVA